MTLIVFMLFVTACSGTGKEEGTGTVDTGPKESGTEEIKPVTLTFLSAWNGGGAGFPQDQENNPVAQQIREKTGVTLKLESITTSEVEKLNTIFASGTVRISLTRPSGLRQEEKDKSLRRRPWKDSFWI